MSTNEILTHNTKQNKPSRRTFLTRALALAGALPFVANAETLGDLESFPNLLKVPPTPPIEDCQCPHCSPDLWQEVPQRAPDFPDPARIVAIERYWWQIQEMRIAIDRFDDLITEARALAPGKVDGYALFESMNEAAIAAGRFDAFLIGNDDIIEHCTGAPATVFCLEDDIINRRSDATWIRQEIDHLKEDYPEQAARLKALLASEGGAS